MSASTLYRCSGAALLVGGALAILGALLEIGADPGSATWIPGAWLSLAGMLLMVLGWPGLYLHCPANATRRRWDCWGLCCPGSPS